MTFCIGESCVQNCPLSVGSGIPMATSGTKLPLDLNIRTAAGLGAKPSKDKKTVKYVHTQVPFPKD